MIDYHIHTSLCNHAEGTMEAYISKAVSVGLREICFLDHLTFNKAGRMQSMSPEEVPLYLYAVRRFKQKFKGVIKIKAGLEIDFNLAYIDVIEETVNRFSFDVIGSSVHFAGDWNIVSRKAEKDNKKLKFERIYELYLACLDKMLEYDYFDFVCHLDIIKKFNRKASRECEEKLENKFDEILSKISYNNQAVEINTSGYDHPVKELYPSEHLLVKCREKNISVTLGSDAHSPDDVGQHYDKAASAAYSAGYRYLAAFTERNRYDIPLKSYDND